MTTSSAKLLLYILHNFFDIELYIIAREATVKSSCYFKKRCSICVVLSVMSDKNRRPTF